MIRFLPFVWRNLWRDASRTLLTGAAIAFATALICLLRTMPSGLDAVLSSLAKNSRIGVHNRAGVVYFLPYSYLAKVRSVPGVVEALSWTWFGGMVDKDRGVTFPTFAVNPETVGVVYEDLRIAPEALEDFERYRDGALVGRQTLKRYDWAIGDLVTLASNEFPVAITVRIVGEIPDDRIPIVWFQREYFDQALSAAGISFDQVDIIWARVDDPARVNEVVAAIDGLFRNSADETASETEKSYFGNLFGNLQAFVAVILAITGLVTICVVFIAANTVSMSLRERARELAVMKALGFRPRLLFGMLIAEAVALSMIAGATGALLSLPLSRALGAVAGWSAQLGPLAAFVVDGATLAQSLVLSLFIGVAASVVPAWGVARQGVATTLRESF